MTFSYYNRLSSRDQAVYRKSDAATSLDLPQAERLRPLVEELRGVRTRRSPRRA